MDDDLFPELGDLVFSMLISYAGALELLYVVRHLYHWSCGHASAPENDPGTLKEYKERMREQLAKAEALEQKTGLKAMQDGVLYKDGFRVDPQQAGVDQFKAEQLTKEQREQRRLEMEAELKKQQEIEEQTRKELERAEAELARQRREAEEAEKRQRAEAETKARKQQEEEARLAEQKEIAENARKLLEAELAREEAQRQEELQREEEENTRKLLEAERALEEAQRQEELRREEEENTRKLLEAERAREEEEKRKEAEAEAAAARAREEEERRQSELEAAENERKLLEAESAREAAERQREEEQEAADNEMRLIEAERAREADERERELQEVEEAEISIKRADVARDVGATAAHDEPIDEQSIIDSIQKYLDIETERELREKEEKQRLIEENARKFLEADQEMGELLLKRQMSATEYAPLTPVSEPPCVKKVFTPGYSSPDDEEPIERITQTVKTQFGQVSHEPYSLTSKPLLFKSISDDTSSIEPQSSLSGPLSDELATGTDDTVNNTIAQLERPEPDGEDNENMPSMQYSDDYLRSLDGIKNRPLVREDGSGRRRAFKKRRSSGSSNSSRDSKASRDEEVKMFTSLEEEEMQANKRGEEEFTPIKYTSEPTLKVKGHRRRHKRSPAKDMKPADSNARSSLEMLDEENTNPWGELVPEHYKDMEFWKREKALSIDEEEIEFERPSSRQEAEEEGGANKVPKTSSFEEATHTENEAAITALQQQQQPQQPKNEGQAEAEDKPVQEVSPKSETKPNLETSPQTGDRASPARSSASPRLRRSPRIDEIDHYEDRWNAELAAAASTVPQTPQTPSIVVDTPTESWRDEHGLLLEGLSDFYDFTASVNASRSRSVSRQASPAPSQPGTPLPKNVVFETGEENSEEIIVEVYDDSEALLADEFRRENIVNFIETMEHSNTESMEMDETAECDKEAVVEHEKERSRSPLKLNIQAAQDYQATQVDFTPDNDDSNNLGTSLHTHRSSTRSHSRSRSRSPLPTPDNLEQSLETRRQKLIRQNDDLFEKLGVQSPVEIEIQTTEDVEEAKESIVPEEECSRESMSLLVESLRQGRSRSRSRSPLPTPDNLERGLKKRREKLIRQNDEVFEKLNVQSPVEIEIQTVEDIESQTESHMSEHDNSRENMSLLVESLRQQRSRSRSRSPLPTADNFERGLKKRREKLIQKNDEAFEKLNVHSPVEIEIQTVEDIEMQVESHTPEKMSLLVESQRQRRSRSRSPLPTADNFERGLKNRREKLIQQNDDLFEKIHQASPIEIEIQPAEDEETMRSPEEECSRESMHLLVEKLRHARSRSTSRAHSRSHSPLPTPMNIERSLEQRRQKRIQHNDELFEQLLSPTEASTSHEIVAPLISIEYVEDTPSEMKKEEECSREQMSSLVEMLRQRRSRSTSKSPMHFVQRGRTPEPDDFDEELMRDQRSRTPSRSASGSPHQFEESESPIDYDDFHVMLNLEASTNRTLIKRTEEWESILAEKQRSLDEEALHKLRTANEETELRTLTPTTMEKLDNESNDRLSDMPVRERLHQLRCTPTTPDYNRTISEEWRDVQRIKNEMMAKGFKRSTYVGESMDLGAEYEQLREETARFRRSQSPSPSFVEGAMNEAKDKQEVQAQILAELVRASENVGDEELDNESNDRLSDMPVRERLHQLRCTPTTPDYNRTISEEYRDVQRIKHEMISKGFKRSTYVGESMDLGAEYESLREETARFRRSQSPSPSSVEGAMNEAKDKQEVQAQILAELIRASENVGNEARLGAKPKEYDLVESDVTYNELRRINAEFQRSRSCSRSPLGELQTVEVARIEAEALKRELKDRVLDEVELTNVNFQEFSRHLNPDFLDTDRRASDSVLIQKAELLMQEELELDPEDYHHFRRFSLNQEQPVEEYPNDDYVYVSQIEVKTPTGTRTWIREDYYSEDYEQLQLLSTESGLFGGELMEEAIVEQVEEVPLEREEEESEGSEDERQTVVDVDDEIEEDICDYNERGTADESHHEQSECEEAEREMDRYANRGANDWPEDGDINYFLGDNDLEVDEGAVGGASPGVAYDSDSRAIDQIYDEAIKDRKQSGIMRDFDSILKDMQNSYKDKDESEVTSENDRYAIWAKTRTGKKNREGEATVKFLENERKEGENRYLGDATQHARQSTRLRSRYGYVPLLHSNAVDEVEVDLNYKPKREYNWRKNFKLDDDGQEIREQKSYENSEENGDNQQEDTLDWRKYSLGGESITLFSQSPERITKIENEEENAERMMATQEVENEVTLEVSEKPKKKKSKKKKKINNETYNNEEDDSESQLYSRRSSSIQMETDSPKRKSRSRRSSKSSLNNEDIPTFSPRGSVANTENTEDTSTTKKKIKKRKKAKTNQEDIREEQPSELNEKLELSMLDLSRRVDTASAIITPNTASSNMLAVLSPQDSICATPGSLEEEVAPKLSNSAPQLNGEVPPVTDTKTTTTANTEVVSPPPEVTVTTHSSVTPSATTRTTVDTFDILKDANFYPLF